MKKILLALAIAASFVGTAFADTQQRVAIVNLTQVYNNSSFVKDANKKLQADAKASQGKFLAAQKKLQGMVDDYNSNKDKMTPDDRIKQQAQIASQQVSVNQLNQNLTQQIRQEQSAGMQKFLSMARAAAQKVAAQKGYNVVLTNTEALYVSADADITKDVEAAM